MKKLSPHFVILFVALLLELGLLTFMRMQFGPHGSPVFFFLSAVLIGAYPMWMVIKDKWSVSDSFQRPANRKNLLTGFGVLLLSQALLIPFLHDIFTAYPIDAGISDVIPSVEVYVTRFVGGANVYTPIDDFGYRIWPTYLPMMWLPFVPAELLGVDYRWFAYGYLFIALIWFTKTVSQTSSNPGEAGLKVIMPLVFLGLISQMESQVFGVSIETMIIAAYLFFGLALWYGKSKLIGTILIFCLLSRYSLVLWLPALGLMLLMIKKWKDLSWIVGISAAGLVILYIIPYLSKNWTLFTDGLHYYTLAAQGEWFGDQHGGSPFHLKRGLGFAIYFFDFIPGEIPDRIAVLQKVHFALSAGTAVLLSGIFYRFKGRIDWPIFALLSLKIYLAVFYAFIQVPYIYLQILPVFLSFLIVGLIPMWKSESAVHATERES